MDMSTIINSVLSLFIIMLVGVFASKKSVITPEINRGLTDILLNIALPFLIISSFILTYDDNVKNNVAKAFYLSLITFIIIGLASYIVLIPIKKDKKIILQFSNVFTNTGYVGFPILAAVYGSEAILYGSIFQIFYTIFIWTYGIILFKGRNIGEEESRNIRESILEVLLNPCVIAVFIGILIMAFNIRLPNMLLMSVNAIGGITGPLSMIIVGVILSNVNIKSYLKDYTIYYGIIVKLMVIPAIVYFILIFISDISIIINTLVILAAMPSAIMTSIFAESYNKQKDYATVVVFLTTVLSIFTIPILLKIII